MCSRGPVVIFLAQLSNATARVENSEYIVSV